MDADGSNSRTIAAGEFKDRCLALMDEVNETGEEIVITKRGKPVSRLVPVERAVPDMLGRYRDAIKITGDIERPIWPLENSEAFSNPERVLDPELPRLP